MVDIAVSSQPLSLKLISPRPADAIDWLEGLPLAALDAGFAGLGGWSLQVVKGPEPAGEAWSMPLEPQPGGYRVALRPTAVRPGVEDGVPPASVGGSGPVGPIRALACGVGGLLAEVVQLRRALWQREAELAAGVPVLVPPTEDQHLAQRLVAVLRGGAQAVGCQAAALYLLDEATTSLKLRAAWGLPSARLLDPARPLKGALADLEALAGHAVVLEDTSLLAHWRCPEAYAAAACVPVSTATVPLGTLWVFCDRVREFSAQETNLLEIVAGRIASDLEREMLLVEAAKAKARQQQQVAAARWLAQRRPTVPPCIEDYQVAGAAPSEELQGSFYDWFGLPDGSLLVVAGHAPGQGWEAALAATAVQAALRAHADRVADPAALLAATSATLQAASPGEEGASLVAVQVRSGDGSVKVAGAGTFTLWNREGDRWQARLHQRPALGMEPDAQTGGFLEAEYPLVIGQTLAVSVGSGGQGRTASVAARGLRAKAATAARRSKQASNRGCSAEQLLASLKQAMGRGRLAPDQAGIIVIRRRG
jgi:hypothetical protein